MDSQQNQAGVLYVSRENDTETVSYRPLEADCDGDILIGLKDSEGRFYNVFIFRYSPQKGWYESVSPRYGHPEIVCHYHIPLIEQEHSYSVVKLTTKQELANHTVAANPNAAVSMEEEIEEGSCDTVESPKIEEWDKNFVPLYRLPDGRFVVMCAAVGINGRIYKTGEIISHGNSQCIEVSKMCNLGLLDCPNFVTRKGAIEFDLKKTNPYEGEEWIRKIRKEREEEFENMTPEQKEELNEVLQDIRDHPEDYEHDDDHY